MPEAAHVLLFLLAGLAFFAMNAAIVAWMNRSRLRMWQEVGAARGLIANDGSMSGSLGGFPMEFELITDGHGESATVVARLQVRIGTTGKLSVSPQHNAPADRTLGDPLFDGAARLTLEDACLGLLSPRVRAAWMQLPCELDLEGGVLVLRWDNHGTVQADLEKMLWIGEEVTACWADGRSLTQRLEDGVTVDQPELVQARMLQARLAANDEGAKRLASTLRGSDSRAVRVVVANYLDDHHTLHVTASDLNADPLARQLAASALLGTDHLGTALQSLCASDHRQLWFHACRLGQQAAASGVVHAMTQLHQRGVLYTEAAWSARLASGVAHALRTQEDPAAEPVLLSLLAIDEGDVGLHAARALGTCGTTAAVAPLRARQSDYSMMSPMAGIVRDAVRAIQARASGERGGLAIAENVRERGALSEAEPRRPRRQTESG